MDDRELLERAARAIGGIHQDLAKRCGVELVMHETATGPFWMIDGRHSNSWDPLTDDGDALRLAVKLEIAVRHHHHGVGWVDAGMHKEMIGADPYAATRRAIVRAAAAIATAKS